MRLLFKNWKTGLFPSLLLVLTVCMTACGSETESEAGKSYDIYYVNNEETCIFSNSYQTETEDSQQLLYQFTQQLLTVLQFLSDGNGGQSAAAE